jgi:hypothetical protein
MEGSHQLHVPSALYPLGNGLQCPLERRLDDRAGLDVLEKETDIEPWSRWRVQMFANSAPYCRVFCGTNCVCRAHCLYTALFCFCCWYRDIPANSRASQSVVKRRSTGAPVSWTDTAMLRACHEQLGVLPPHRTVLVHTSTERIRHEVPPTEVGQCSITV